MVSVLRHDVADRSLVPVEFVEDREVITAAGATAFRLGQVTVLGEVFLPALAAAAVIVHPIVPF